MMQCGDKVILFGLSNVECRPAEHYLEEYDKKQKVLMIIDNNPDFAGEFHGIPVRPQSALAGYVNDETVTVIITARYRWEEIRNILLEMGFSKNRIIAAMEDRTFILSYGTLVAKNKVDYLIQNGRVIDPLNGTDEVKDLAVCGNKIIELPQAPKLDWRNGVIDASGCIVTPGLVDFHTHIFHEGSGNSILADSMLSEGVTAAVDAGTAGTANFESFYKTVAATSAIHIRSYLAPYPLGLASGADTHSWDYTKYNMNKLLWLLEEYKGHILGLKMKVSNGKVPVEAANEYLEKLVEIAESQGIGVCVHPTDPPIPAEQIVERLRKGDVFCHCYQGKGSTIINENGKVKREILEARERGVLFDAANGFGGYGLEVCQNALADGFFPDIISTDATILFARKPYYFKNLPGLMSKYLALGMTLPDIVRAVTINPAKAMGMAERIGQLTPGTQADIAILKWKEKPVTFKDCLGASIEGKGLLVPQMTMLGGEIRYCQTDFYTEC